MFTELERLEAERGSLYQALSQVGDFRRGSISVNYRRCGKPNCACAKPEHPGHGPQYLLTTKVNGKTLAKNLRSGPELAKVEQELANHQNFRELVKNIVTVSEHICELKEAETRAEETAKKGASKTGLKWKSSPN
jgi:hypothetical protein